MLQNVANLGDTSWALRNGRQIGDVMATFVPNLEFSGTVQYNFKREGIPVGVDKRPRLQGGKEFHLDTEGRAEALYETL